MNKGVDFLILLLILFFGIFKLESISSTNMQDKRFWLFHGYFWPEFYTARTASDWLIVFIRDLEF